MEGNGDTAGEANVDTAGYNSPISVLVVTLNAGVLAPCFDACLQGFGMRA
jgi:hypothetical protein